MLQHIMEQNFKVNHFPCNSDHAFSCTSHPGQEHMQRCVIWVAHQALHKLQKDNYNEQWSMAPRSLLRSQQGSFKLEGDGCGISNVNTRLRGPALALFHDIVLCHIDTADCLKAAWGFLTQCCIAPWNHNCTVYYDSKRAKREYSHWHFIFCG